jgi:RNA polymerase sigma-70 factor (ECF subfamily)
VQRAGIDVPRLIERAKAYDRDAFGELYRRTLTPVYRYLAARVRTVDEAEELTQDVYLAALAQIERLRAEDESGLYAWLFQIARFKLADHFRARYRRPASRFEDEAEPEDTGPLPEAISEALADREQLREALAMLTDDQREVVICKYILEFSNEETARILGKNANAVNQLHHRALRSLHRLLSANEVTS